MVGRTDRTDRRRGAQAQRVGLALCVLLGTLWLAAACGGAAGAGEPEFLTEGTEVGASLATDAWEITVTGFAGKDTLLGDEGDDAGLASVTQYTTSAQAAKRGVWIIVPVRLKNASGDENLLLSRTLKVRDDQGNEYAISDRLVHLSYVFYTDRETYGSDANLLVQNVFDADEVRDGPAIFDVPEDATGLELLLNGAEGSILIGY